MKQAVFLKTNVPIDPSSEPDPRGLGVQLMEKMREHKENVAQIDSKTLQTESHGEVLLRSIRVAQEMSARGMKPNDIVTLCSYNTFESCLPVFASLFLGVRLASLDPTLPPNDVEHLLGLVYPKMIFCNPENVGLIETALEKLGTKSEIVVFGETDTHTPFANFLRRTGSEGSFKARPVKDMFETAFIFFSSGTTGLAKGICTSHFGITYQQQLALKYINASVCMYFTSFYWISSVMVLISAVIAGGARVICRTFDETQFVKIIENCKVTFAFISPFYVNKILQVPHLKTCDVLHLKSIVIGGGKTDEVKVERLRKILPNALVAPGYGMTETSGYITIFNPLKDKALADMKPTSCGKSIEGMAYKIVDPETEEILGPNTPGELRLKSKSLVTKYYNNPKATKDIWDSDGFLKTGDVVYYDNDRCFYVVERIKEMLKYQSWHVIPSEIEHLLLNHPDVKEAAVIGTPHEVDGEHPTGVVVLKSGTNTTAQELVKFIDDQVSDRKKLRGGIKFIDTIPRTPTGKVRKLVLQNII